MRPIFNRTEILIIMARAYFVLSSMLKIPVKDIFVVLCLALADSVLQVFVRNGELKVTVLARSFVDQCQDSSIRVEIVRLGFVSPPLQRGILATMSTSNVSMIFLFFVFSFSLLYYFRPR